MFWLWLVLFIQKYECSDSFILIWFLSYFPGDHFSWGPNFLGTKFPGDQISWGPNFSGTKFLRDQKGAGSRFLGPKFLAEPNFLGTKKVRGPNEFGDHFSYCSLLVRLKILHLNQREKLYKKYFFIITYNIFWIVHKSIYMLHLKLEFSPDNVKNCWCWHSWDPYPPYIDKHRQWGHLSSPKICRHLKWMVPNVVFYSQKTR